MRSPVLLLLGLGLAWPTWGAELHFRFGDAPRNHPPPGFRSLLAGSGQPGKWVVRMDKVPPLLAPLTSQAPDVARRAVLAQVSTAPGQERFPILLYENARFGDFTFTTRFKIVSGAQEEMAGVVFRAQDASNFYVFRASALGHDVRFYKVVHGLRSTPIGPTLNVTTNVWHTLSVHCQGNEIRCSYDGHLAMPTLHDNTFIEGKVGFWTMADSVSYFSDARITYTPRVPLAQKLVNRLMKDYPRLLGVRIYTLNPGGQPRVIASNHQQALGAVGGNDAWGAITNGTAYFGKTQETVLVTLPLRDRNGDPNAAVRFQMKSFPGQTQDNALARARPLLKQMETQVLSRQDLTQ